MAGCVAGLLLCGTCCAQQAPATPAPDPKSSDTAPVITTLRINTRTVEISAVVRNKTGEPQPALAKDDFNLKVDGKEQPIRYFSVGSDLPLTLALLVDVSGSQRTFIGDEWRASDIFFESMLTRPEDRAALVEIDARIRQMMLMTNSVSKLHLALSQLGSSPEDARATLLNDAVYLVARNLGREQGRKAIILLTDGGDNGSRATLPQVVEQAQRANVPIYAIEYSAWAGFTAPTQSLSSLSAGSVNGGRELLNKLAGATGGHVYSVERGMTLKKIYEAISNDLRTQYQLGYTPPPDLQPNSFHKLELRAKDKKLAVQARTGFYVQP
ncbi:MAG: VWA domain-containing protein [Janthinobacterium lividum]